MFCFGNLVMLIFIRSNFNTTENILQKKLIAINVKLEHRKKLIVFAKNKKIVLKI